MNLEKKAIVLNRMYAGDYLSSNLGHEIINMYKADNGNHYLYLNSLGNFAKVHTGKVDYMLFVKYYAKNVMEIIGMATGLEDVPGANMSNKRNATDNKDFNELRKSQIDFINAENGIRYGDVSILDIFNEAEQQNVFITYKTKKVSVPKERNRIFICYSEESEKEIKDIENVKIVTLKGYNQAKTSLKSYIYPGGTKGDNNKEKDKDYNRIIDEIINNSDLWDSTKVNTVNIDNSRFNNEKKISLIDICKIQNDENAFSNALAYFMKCPQYYDLWKGFFKEVCNIELKTSLLDITREQDVTIENNDYSGGRIDLLIQEGNNVIVIENKIKSDINKSSIDKDYENQLWRYKKFVDIKFQSHNKYLIILAPGYNKFKAGDEWLKISYKQLYDYLKTKESVFIGDANFVAFHNAMYRHTHKNENDYLYYEMQDKFFRRIKDCKND